MTGSKTAAQHVWILRLLLLLYMAASLLHFIHNAEYVNAYPNLPEWISRSSVYFTWLAIATIGVVGYLFYHFKKLAIGIALLFLYAAFGLDGLLHYTRAPMHAHTNMMNFTIWFEVIVASILLIYLLLLVFMKRLRLR